MNILDKMANTIRSYFTRDALKYHFYYGPSNKFGMLKGMEDRMAALERKEARIRNRINKSSEKFYKKHFERIIRMERKIVKIRGDLDNTYAKYCEIEGK